MANTYSQIYIHLVFAVKHRQHLTHQGFKDELYKYIAGIIRNKGQKLLAINGMPDHIHIFIGLEPDMKLSDLVRDIKSASSLFVNEKHLSKQKFHWQEGYGAFSYSQSQRSFVIKYIMEQEKHHGKRTFRTEYHELLKKFETAFEEKYLFEFFD